jgi:hypothetical protein
MSCLTAYVGHRRVRSASKWLQRARDQHQPELTSVEQVRLLLHRMLIEEAETLVETDSNAA